MKTAKAKIITSGGRQAVRLPVEFRIEDGVKEVDIRRQGNSIVIELPRPLRPEGDDWAWLDNLQPFSDDMVKAIYDEFGYPDDGSGTDKPGK